MKKDLSPKLSSKSLRNTIKVPISFTQKKLNDLEKSFKLLFDDIKNERSYFLEEIGCKVNRVQ